MLAGRKPNRIIGPRLNTADYTKEFDQVVEKVTSKIYRRKVRRKFLVANKISPDFMKEEEREESLNASITSESCRVGSQNGLRKNSPSTKNSLFYRTIKHGRPKAEIDMNST